MQEPALRVAKHPGPLPLRVAGDEIIAPHVAGGIRFAFVPPTALQAFGARQQLQRTMPVRPAGALAERLRCRQQPERARRRACCGRHWFWPGIASHLECPRRTFRPVIGQLSERLHGIRAQPRAQALKAGQRPLADRRLGEELGALPRLLRHLVGAQAQGLDRCRQPQARQMLAQQAQEAPLVGRRFGETQDHLTLRAIVVRQLQRTGAQQRLAPVQPAAQASEQALPGKGQVFGMLDAGRQFEGADKALRKHESRLRVGHLAQAFEAERAQARQHLAGPAGNAARQGGKRRLHGWRIMVDRADPGLGQPARGVGATAQRTL